MAEVERAKVKSQWAWQHLPVIPEFRKLKEKDYKFKANP